MRKIKEFLSLLWRDKKYVLTKLLLILFAVVSIVGLVTSSHDADSEYRTAQAFVSLLLVALPVTTIYESDFESQSKKRGGKKKW